MNKKFTIIIVAVVIILGAVIWTQKNKGAQGDELPISTTSPEIATTTDALDQSPVRVEARINQEVSGLGVEIMPVAILEDSRCPVDVTCIQAGTVRIRAKLESGLGIANQIFELDKPITTEVEEVTLVAVEPAALSQTQITADQYRFTFLIKKR